MKFIEFRASVRLLIAFLALTASHIHAASFDCTKARSQVEHLVCDTPALSQQDETLAAIYKVALANDPAARQRQVTWLRETRDRCNDAPCLAVAYQTQIQAMGASPPAAMPAPVAQPNAAPSALQLACPPDWNALTDIDGPNPERVILGLKAREWRKEHIDMVLAKTQECQRSNSAPESVKKAELVDIQTRAYPNAVAAIDRRDQRPLQDSQRAQQVAQPSVAEVPPQGIQASAAPKFRSENWPASNEMQSSPTRRHVMRRWMPSARLSAAAMTSSGSVAASSQPSSRLGTGINSSATAVPSANPRTLIPPMFQKWIAGAERKLSQKRFTAQAVSGAKATRT